MIEQFKAIDKRYNNVAFLKSKYGKANWDLSFVLNNSNGLMTLVTPFSNEADSITCLLFSYQKRNKTIFKIVTKKDISYLSREGNQEASKFNQSSLIGLFESSKSSIKLSKSLHRTSLLRESSYNIHWICWNYEWRYTNANGIVTVGATTTQCTYRITYLGKTTDPISDGEGNTGGYFNETWEYHTTPIRSIITDSLTPCAQNLIDTLRTYHGNIFDTVLNNIFGTSRDYDLKFLIAKNFLIDTTVAATTRSQLNNYGTYFGESIHFQPKYLSSATQLSIASTILHESIHAYLNYLFITNADQTAEQFKAFVQLYSFINLNELYKNDNSELATKIKVAYAQSDQNWHHHNVMATKYIASISELLKRVDGNRLSDSYYFAMAWGGLMKTKAWNDLPNRGYDTIHIKNINFNEDTGNSNAQGKRCN